MKYLLWIVIVLVLILLLKVQKVHAQTKEELKDCQVIANTFIEEVGIAKALK